MIVEVDPDLLELIPGFIERKRQDLYALTAALERLDYQMLRSIGHKIKGEGAGFGFDAVSEIGQALEDAARARDTDAAHRQVRALSDYLDCIEVRPASDHSA